MFNESTALVARAAEVGKGDRLANENDAQLLHPMYQAERSPAAGDELEMESTTRWGQIRDPAPHRLIQSP
jgi:hypothetical protein